MKKARSMFLLLLLLLLAAQPAAAASKTSQTSKIRITFASADLVANNHVGNEWWTGGYVNGKEIAEGSSVTLTVKPTDVIKLKAEAQEQDKYPDNGQANASVKASSITKTTDKTLTVNVVENRGRYSGNTAKWSFTFKIQKVS
ncbi:hypothetical protein GXP70_06890 [Paenibacillus lycopersici]|uniref:Uncharacterized protein n=1 Tax=Paenibacillus lycopersici TaxID=2704462 RepID=A0A6C0FW75_9BACL|nr:hypothetical protein [Paenibacillus lycopersici]QHT59703.1 hypothetical protein GXP70_06890 [Paenibacillus lycopersici]